MKILHTLFGLLLIISLTTGCSSRKVCVVGGTDNNGDILNSVDIYDPDSGIFTQSVNVMSTGRLTATATTINDNTIVIVGGQGPSALQTAEIYHPINDSFSLTSGGLNHTRVAHTATFLNPAVVNGALANDVLIAGGDALSRNGTAELYIPSSKTFINTANMMTSRRQHTAVLISNCGCAADGSVLITGGYDNQFNVLTSAELYNPATQTFIPTGSMSTPRFRHTATLLSNGTVLISGGASQMAAKTGNVNPSLNTAEIYDPKTGKFTATGTMTAHREAHAASLLKDGTVLLTGGQDDHFLIENTAEIYDPVSKTFHPTSVSCAGAPPPAGCMSAGRNFHISQTLDNGNVLIAGGVNSSFVTVASAEIYNPVTRTFTLTGSMTTPRSGAAVALTSQ